MEQLLRRLSTRPLSGSGDSRNGRTPYDRLKIALNIVQGTATIDDVRLEGPNVCGSGSMAPPRYRSASSISRAPPA